MLGMMPCAFCLFQGICHCCNTLGIRIPRATAVQDMTCRVLERFDMSFTRWLHAHSSTAVSLMACPRLNGEETYACILTAFTS